MRRCFLALTLGVALAGAPLAAQNLLVNPDFDADASGWMLDCGSSLTWIPDDEAGCPGSGAVHVTSGPCNGVFDTASIAQCLPVAEGIVLSVTGRVRASFGFVLGLLSSYSTTDCSGAPTMATQSQATPVTGDWQTIVFDDFTVQTGTASILLAFKTNDVTPVSADFDAGYAGEQPLVFHDNFEADSASAPPSCRWSSITP